MLHFVVKKKKNKTVQVLENIKNLPKARNYSFHSRYGCKQKKMNITFKFNLGREPVTNANYLVKKIKQDQGTGRDVGRNAIS